MGSADSEFQPCSEISLAYSDTTVPSPELEGSEPRCSPEQKTELLLEQKVGGHRVSHRDLGGFGTLPK